MLPDSGYGPVDSMLAPVDLGIPLAANRARELAVTSVLITLSWDIDGSLVLASIAGALRAWQRFDQEREFFQHLGRSPDVWRISGFYEALLSARPFPELPAIDATAAPFSSLGPDARLVLVSAGALTTRCIVHPDIAAEQAWLHTERPRAAIAELREAGWAKEPSLAERLSKARVHQLGELAKPAGVRAARKVELIKQMIAVIPEAEILGWLGATDPRWVDPSLVVLAGTPSEAGKWWAALSYLVAHSLWATATIRGREGSEILTTDDCVACTREVAGFERPKRPPFHLGCRCEVIMNNKDLGLP
jgi:hypothetical protein